MTEPLDPGAETRSLDRRIDRAVARARLVRAWEIVWREAIAPIWLIGLAVALAWLGLADLGGSLARPIAVILAVAVVVAALRAGLRIAETLAEDDRAAALRRIEIASGLRARELSGWEDRLADADATAPTRRLWELHRRRLAGRLDRLVVGPPRPDLQRRDRFALRPALGLLLFVGWFAASGEHLARLVALIDAPAGAEEIADRLDLWIDPPAHTGLPPRVVALEVDPAAVPLSVIEGSRLVLRAVTGRPGVAPRPVAVKADPVVGLAEAALPGAALAATTPDAPVERRWSILADATLTVLRGGAELVRRRLVVTPDRPPTIRLVEPPSSRGRALRLVHETDDDWGVADAEARLTLVAPAPARSLYAAPDLPLTLPTGPRRAGRGETLRDLSAHPLAGATVDLALVAHDALGREGRAEVVRLLLPERPFRAPLARALAELRRRLATDAEAVGAVAIALDALTLAPEHFGERAGLHLGLRHLARAAARARADDELRALVDLLWTAAVTIDAGDTLDEERALKEARDALREALTSGASPEEIARLTRELRAAMDRYLQALAEAGRRHPEARGEEAGRDRRVDRRALDRMLDRIEGLGRTGSREAAERLLSELGDTLDALRGARPGRAGSGDRNLEQLGDIIRRQRELMDRTHRDGRDGTAPEVRDRLRRDQDGLRDDLRRLGRSLDRPGEGGAGGGGEPGDALGDADRAMGEAGEALADDDGDTALDAQGRALDGLRRGARELADRSGDDGPEGSNGEPGGEEDPLGRPRRGREGGGRVALPEEIDVERARRILDDIRRRLADPDRPRLERDYLDRLLRLD